MSAARRSTPVSNALLGTLLFATADAMVFTGLAASFLVLRSQYVTWPPIGQPRLPVEITALNTLALLASGVACELAARAPSRRGEIRGLAAAMGLGGAFLLLQGREWWALVRFGMTAESVYGSLFYAVVGTHALHVAGSLGVLAWGLAASVRGALAADTRSALRAWWWFVVGVWPLLYALVYLW